MAEETRFHEQKLDRTAYGALWAVGGIVIVVYALGAYALFQAGTAARHLRVNAPHLSLPNPASAVQSAKDQADTAAKQAAQSAADNAAAQAKQAATQKLNQFLSP